MSEIIYLNKDEFFNDVALIKINKLYREGMSDLELYERTRGYWRIKKETLKNVKYAFAIYQNIVLEVYEIKKWENSGTIEMQTRETKKINDRIEFVGDIAKESIRNQYVGKSVSKLYKQGEANPIKIIKGISEGTKIIDVNEMKEYKYITDILNDVFGNRYDGWMKAVWPSNNSNANFRVWFPQLAIKDKDGNNKAATFGCVNVLSQDWNTLTYTELKQEVNCKDNAYFGYQLVFAKEVKGNYIFRGVYIVDKDKLKTNESVYKRVAAKVKLIGKPVNKIEVLDDEENIKDYTETILNKLVENKEKYKIKSNKVNTAIFCEGKKTINVYYRQNEIRINIKTDSELLELYPTLLEEKLAFQKDSADPNSTEGVFAFFVERSNIERVFVHLLFTINDEVQAQPIEYNKVVCCRCTYQFKKSIRCPNCGQLIKYGG